MINPSNTPDQDCFRQKTIEEILEDVERGFAMIFGVQPRRTIVSAEQQQAKRDEAT